MASGLFFDPIVALRAAPLVSSTCTLLFAWDQHFFFGHLNRPENRSHSKPLVRTYFTGTFYRGASFVVGAVAVSFWAGIGNLYVERAKLQAQKSFWWYAAGAGLALSHLTFVPAIAPSCQALIDQSECTDANESLDSWLTINAARSLSVDLAAWVAFVVATVKALHA